MLAVYFEFPLWAVLMPVAISAAIVVWMRKWPGAQPRTKRTIVGFIIGACAGILPFVIYWLTLVLNPPQAETWGMFLPGIIIVYGTPLVGLIAGIIGARIGLRNYRDTVKG